MMRERIGVIANLIGVDLHRVLSVVRGMRGYLRRRAKFMEVANLNHDFAIGSSWPCFEAEDSTSIDKHYFQQDLYVAQQIFAADPECHIDVASRIDGFVAHVASFRQIHVYDIRPIQRIIPNIVFHHQDLMVARDIPENSTDSLSCLHALEHFGLGRYGDRLDYYGFKSGFSNLARMLRPRGTLYLSVPIGEVQRVEFDAHRIFSVPYLVDNVIAGQFDIVKFAYIDDIGDIHRDVDVQASDAATSFGLRYGCGIFTLCKRSQ